MGDGQSNAQASCEKEEAASYVLYYQQHLVAVCLECGHCIIPGKGINGHFQDARIKLGIFNSEKESANMYLD